MKHANFKKKHHLTVEERRVTRQMTKTARGVVAQISKVGVSPITKHKKIGKTSAQISALRKSKKEKVKK